MFWIKLISVRYCVSGFVAFFVTICYHMICAAPWIFPPLAFLGFDHFMRLVRHRFKDATLFPIDKTMSLVTKVFPFNTYMDDIGMLNITP